MTDTSTSDGLLLTPDGTPSAPKTAGGLLKAARQQAGVHLAVLSANLKVPVRQLEALEADQFLSDPNPVFARALASSVCRQLRVSPDPILALMPRAANYLESDGAVRHVYAAPADLGRVQPSSAAVPAKAWWLSAGMLVLIAVLVWSPPLSQWRWLEGLSAAVSTPSATPSPTPAPTQPPLPTPASPDPVTEPATTAAPVLSGSLQAAADPQPAVPELSFSAISSSWIEVRDSKNQPLWSGVLNAGEVKQWPAPQALSVVLGRADAVQVRFKGQPFDLKPHTQSNVARFEVKP